MSWLGLVIAIVCIYFAIKVIGFLLKLALWVVALGALYWFVAPYLGLPQLF